MPEIQLPGIRIYYEEAGEGTPILCIHGTSGSAMTWAGATSALGQLGRAITYDRRGCTRSERPGEYERTTVRQQVDDAAALLQALAATPAVVIGRSYGGAVALGMALYYPEHVRALVLLEPGDAYLPPGMQAWAKDMERRLEAIAASEGVDAVGEAMIRDVLGDEAWDQFPSHVREMFRDNSPAVLAECRGGPLLDDVDPLNALDVPVLLVAASDSPEMFREAVDAIAIALPNCRTLHVPGGHLVDPADPGILDFIQSAVGGTQSAVA